MLIEKDLLKKYNKEFNEVIELLIQKNKFYCLNNIIEMLIKKDLLQEYINNEQFDQIIEVLREINTFGFLSDIINKLIEKNLLKQYITYKKFNEIIQVLIEKNEFNYLSNIINKLIEKDLLYKYHLTTETNNLLLNIKHINLNKQSACSAIDLLKNANKAYDKTLELPNQLQEQNQLQVQIKKSFSFKIFCLLNKKMIIRDLFSLFDKKLCDFRGIKYLPGKTKPNQLQQL
jgi:hypothetical protein